MTPMLFATTVLITIAAGSALALAALRRRHPSPVRVPGAAPWFAGDGSPDGAAQTLCDRACDELSIHFSVLAKDGNELHLLGCAPRRPCFHLSDAVAAQWAINHDIPTGRGTGVLTASDWQFHPIFSGGLLSGLAAIKARRRAPKVSSGGEARLQELIDDAGNLIANGDRVEAARGDVAITLA